MKPHFGHTKHGLPVHQRTIDHHRADTVYQRFNKRVATLLGKYVGTMTCFWVFCMLAVCSLPAILNEFAMFHGDFPSWLIATSLIALVAWVSSNFIQLVLLPALMVNQNLQNEAADARAAKQFEDTEMIADRLDLTTEGGLATVESHLATQDQLLNEIRDRLGKDR